MHSTKTEGVTAELNPQPLHCYPEALAHELRICLYILAEIHTFMGLRIIKTVKKAKMMSHHSRKISRDCYTDKCIE